MFFDLFFVRFYFYLFFFVLFMNWFVLGATMFTTMIGWEFLGLFSFFLISYWFYRMNTLKCAFRAVLIGKFGDFFFMLAFCFILFDLSGFV